MARKNSIKKNLQSSTPSLNELIQEQLKRSKEFQMLAEEHLKAVNQYLIEHERQKQEELKRQKMICQRCPNNFECPFTSLSLASRQTLCTIMRRVPQYSSVAISSKGCQIRIPEKYPTWLSRLQLFLDEHRHTKNKTQVLITEGESEWGEQLNNFMLDHRQ